MVKVYCEIETPLKWLENGSEGYSEEMEVIPMHHDQLEKVKELILDNLQTILGMMEDCEQDSESVLNLVRAYSILYDITNTGGY